MTVDHDVPGLEVFGHSRESFKMPCGYVDVSGVVHNEIILREMTGEEEDMMDDDNLVVTERITGILASCCLKIGNVEDADTIRDIISGEIKDGLPFTGADRLAMLLFLRRVSVGDTYKFEQKCPHCDALNKNRAVRLDELEIKYVARPDKRKVKVTLPRSKKEVVLKVLTGVDEVKITQLKAEKDIRSLAMIARIESINGEALVRNPRANLPILKQLPLIDRQYLRRVYDMMEGSVDTDIEVRCSKCQKDFVFELDLGQVFFSPQVESVLPDTVEWM